MSNQDSVIEIIPEEGVRKSVETSNEENFSRNLSGPPKRAISMEICFIVL